FNLYRKVMVERNHAEITVKRQADLLSVNRTSVYRHRRNIVKAKKTCRLCIESTKFIWSTCTSAIGV
ncbi:hypothetical protein, partial [Paenibacillus larvae]|uniref:hypothetical protein n=1 Tax=Paenibacillus larvae TaxID=1464 RepID=UPI0030EBBEE4